MIIDCFSVYIYTPPKLTCPKREQPSIFKGYASFRGSVYVPRTHMTHILEDLTHKKEGQPLKIEVS